MKRELKEMCEKILDDNVSRYILKGYANGCLYLLKALEKRQKEMPQEFEVKVLWGAYPENDAKLQTYKFKTIAEMEAFKQGISEACGWNDYQIMTEREYKEWKEFNNQ
ncbi:MAG: hypothetical protein ACYSWP_23455 [Planctomycetota bacterium]|jgi:hypothetical protein